jgi:hypothetical protein
MNECPIHKIKLLIITRSQPCDHWDRSIALARWSALRFDETSLFVSILDQSQKPMDLLMEVVINQEDLGFATKQSGTRFESLESFQGFWPCVASCFRAPNR